MTQINNSTLYNFNKKDMGHTDIDVHCDKLYKHSI